ncbi:MAG: S8 family serine peptidase [Candidatus Eisenbacteria bacterium]|nr:S8 family serine peptidase [Candidatus Eisenbacteria bacterium]
MRAISPLLSAALLLIAFGLALADPSIVADLDSNATNGPDTLEVEPGDTVLVRIWITGSSDSLFGFGITVGDTSGVLAWIEDSASAILVTPNAWTDFQVLQDENGFLLLQPYDFSFSQPLHLPSEVARLRFIAIAGGECATLAWDSTMCGWQNTEFAEGTFAGFEEAVVCVAGEEDGGGEDEQDGEGGVPPDDDSATPFVVRGVTSYPPPDRDVAEGMIIVQFRKGVFVPDYLPAREGDLSDVEIPDPRVRAALDSAGVERWTRLAWPQSSPVSPSDPVFVARNGTAISYESKARTFVLHADARVSTGRMLKKIEPVAHAYVYAEPLVAWEEFEFPSEPDTTPSDSLYVRGAQSWAEPIDTSGSPLRYGIDAPGAWKRTTGNPAIRLGIVDTGIKRFHPDFVTYPDSQLVYEFYDTCWPEDSLEPWASSSHGTSVLGIAAGLTHNKRDPADSLAIGTAGIAGGTRGDPSTMVRTKMYKYSGAGECAAPHGMIVALDQGITDGMDIMNFSNGGRGLSYAEALTRAYQAGITIVAAIGNCIIDEPLYVLPGAAQTNRTISISNGRITGERYRAVSGSCRGRWNDVMAPGHEAVAPTWESPWWGPFGGTSAASPMVAGACALLASDIWSYYHDHSLHEELEALIIAGAVESGPDTILGQDMFYGHGFLNIRNSIRYLNHERFRRGRFLATGLDGNTVTFVGARPVFLGTGGEYLPVVSPVGDTLEDGNYEYAEIYRATRTIGLPPGFTGDSVLVAGIGHGSASQIAGSSGWASGDSIWLNDSLGGSYLRASLFRDRFCNASLLPGNEIELTSYFWRFPLSPTDTVWAPFDPIAPGAEVRWAYAVFGESACASVSSGSGTGPSDALGFLRFAPNPSNPSTEIRWRVRERARVEILIFDVRGRCIRTLYEAVASGDEEVVVWDGRDDSGRNVSSGTYFARIRVAGADGSAKILLLR